jgi:hypothetical protein
VDPPQPGHEPGDWLLPEPSPDDYWRAFATALAVLTAELRQAIAPRLSNQPTPDRARHLLRPILFPMEQPPPTVEPE